MYIMLTPAILEGFVDKAIAHLSKGNYTAKNVFDSVKKDLKEAEIKYTYLSVRSSSPHFHGGYYNVAEGEFRIIKGSGSVKSNQTDDGKQWDFDARVVL